MLAFLAFMALRLRLLQSAEFLCQNGPHEAKKLQNFNKCSCGLVCGLWKIFWPFLFFWGSLIPKKSSGMQKSCMWVVSPIKNQAKISIPAHHTCLEEIFGSTSKPPNNIYIQLILGKNASIWCNFLNIWQSRFWGLWGCIYCWGASKLIQIFIPDMCAPSTCGI